MGHDIDIFLPKYTSLKCCGADISAVKAGTSATIILLYIMQQIHIVLDSSAVFHLIIMGCGGWDVDVNIEPCFATQYIKHVQITFLNKIYAVLKL